jgi:hypothetical protein
MRRASLTGPTVQFSFRMERELHRRMKVYAIEHGVGLGVLMIEAMQAYLNHGEEWQHGAVTKDTQDKGERR